MREGEEGRESVCESDDKKQHSEVPTNLVTQVQGQGVIRLMVPCHQAQCPRVCDKVLPKV
eukprot:1157438-Pelagomonas_calceolata.AAC.9